MANRRVTEAKKEVQYALRKGTQSNGVSAEVIAEMLDKIQAENGKVTPELWINYAKPKNSPTHKTITWDDAKAAMAHRLAEARHIIRAVIIVKEDATSHMMVKVDEERGYQPMSEVVQVMDMYEIALNNLQKKANEIQRSIDELIDAAKESPNVDQERMAKITMIVQAFRAADSALRALH